MLGFKLTEHITELFEYFGVTASAAPPPFRPGNPAFCGSRHPTLV